MDLPDDKNDAAIVKSIVTMAKTLELQVTTESAETKEQVEFLRDLSCDFLQGYYYSQPISVKDLELFVRNYSNHID